MRKSALIAGVLVAACTGDDGPGSIEEPAPTWSVGGSMVGYRLDQLATARDGDAFVLLNRGGVQAVRRWRADTDTWNGIVDLAGASATGRIAIDDGGDALVMSADDAAIMASTFEDGEAWAPAWSAPMPAIESFGVVIGVASLSHDATGRAAVMWLEQFQEPLREELKVALFEPGGGWSTPHVLTDERAWGKVVLAEVGGERKVVAAWGNGTQVHASVMSGDGAWSDAERVDEAASLESTLEELAIDRRGEVTALLRTYDGSTRLLAVQHTPLGWMSSHVLAEAPGRILQMTGALAVGPEGDAVAAWATGCDDGCGMRAAHRTASGWSEPVDLLTPDATVALVLAPRIVTSGDVAMAIWSDSHTLFTSWYNGRRWSAPFALHASVAGSIDAYELSMGERGGAAAWMESSSQGDTFVQAATFVR